MVTCFAIRNRWDRYPYSPLTNRRFVMPVIWILLFIILVVALGGGIFVNHFLLLVLILLVLLFFL